MSASELLDAMDHDRLDEVSARDVTRALGHRGLRASPSLFNVLADLGEEHWEPFGFESPGLAVAVDRLERTPVTVHASRVRALGGALGVTFSVTCVGLYNGIPYGVVAPVAGLAAAGVVWRSPAVFDRRLQPAGSRGGLFGAGVAAFVVALALLPLVIVREAFGV